MTSQCTVYLLHFERPISDKHTCRHYLGSADDLRYRLHQHRTNPDARLLQVAKERGIDFELARVWSNVPRSFERQLKNRHGGPRLCPICNGSNADLTFTLDDVSELAF